MPSSLGVYRRLSNCTAYSESKGRMILNHEIESMRKEAFAAYFKVRSQHVPTDTEENHENKQST